LQHNKEGNSNVATIAFFLLFCYSRTKKAIVTMLPTPTSFCFVAAQQRIRQQQRYHCLHLTSAYWLCWCSVRCPMQLFYSAFYRIKEFHTHTHIYIYIYIYLCVSVCVLLFTCKFEPMTLALFD
jgi:hypothetical protein